MEGNIEPASSVMVLQFAHGCYVGRLAHFSAMPVAIDKSIDAYQKDQKSATSGIRSRMFN